MVALWTALASASSTAWVMICWISPTVSASPFEHFVAIGSPVQLTAPSPLSICSSLPELQASSTGPPNSRRARKPADRKRSLTSRLVSDFQEKFSNEFEEPPAAGSRSDLSSSESTVYRSKCSTWNRVRLGERGDKEHIRMRVGAVKNLLHRGRSGIVQFPGSEHPENFCSGGPRT